MKRVVMWSGIALTLAVMTSNAAPHHSFEAVYDGDRIVSAEGVVQEFRFVNPHSMLTLESQDADGNPVTWTVEFDGNINLTVHDWTAQTIKAGEHMTVYGNPARAGSRHMFFRRLVRADGTELLRPFDDSANSIDALRKQRR